LNLIIDESDSSSSADDSESDDSIEEKENKKIDSSKENENEKTGTEKQSEDEDDEDEDEDDDEDDEAEVEPEKPINTNRNEKSMARQTKLDGRYDSLGFLPVYQGAWEWEKHDGGGVGEIWKFETQTKLLVVLRTVVGAHSECSVQNEGRTIELRIDTPPLPIHVQTLLSNLPFARHEACTFTLPRHRQLIQISSGQIDLSAKIEVEDVEPGIRLITVKKRIG